MDTGAPQTSGRAIVADSDPLTRALLAAALVEAGLEPVKFESAGDARRALEGMASEGEALRLAFVGADGDGEDALLAAELRRAAPGAHVVALHPESAPAGALAVAADAVLLKPLRAGALEVLLEAAVRTPRGG